SCETIETDPERFWKFEEHPCGDEPTAIQSPSTETRRADPGDLRTKDLTAPIIAMQSAAPAPDPTGLAAALQTLGTPNIFRDATGLSETQRSALASLQSSLTAAQAFGSQAAALSVASLGKQAQTTGNSDKIFKSIDAAEASGHMSKDQAGSLK